VRRRFAEGARDLDVVLRHPRQHDPLALERRLADEALAEPPQIRDVLALLVRVHERRELVEDLARHRE
jgi:hypothetical protein